MENYMTVTETAKYLKIPLSKVYQLVGSGDFPSAKIGKNWRIPQERLEAWVDAQIKSSKKRDKEVPGALQSN